MKIINGGEFAGERALFNSHELEIHDAVFCDGESPLKESSDITLYSCDFRWKYPLWYSKNIAVADSYFDINARSGIWYTENISISNSRIDAPKTFRRSRGIKLKNVEMPNALETLWNCDGIEMDDVTVKGDYFGLGASNVFVKDFRIEGNYIFDGGKNIIVENAELISKDAFWNCENVVVKNSLIVGEYLGWNSKNVTFISCTIESNQGMCYMQNLKLVNCTLRNTDLCFEYCTVDADVNSHIDSVKNPISGRIKARSIGEIILDEGIVDVTMTKISVDEAAECKGNADV